MMKEQIHLAVRVNTSFVLRVNNSLCSLDLSSNWISAEVVNSLGPQTKHVFCPQGKQLSLFFWI